MTAHGTEEKVTLVALAGLLHDIGKLAQRAGWRRAASRRTMVWRIWTRMWPRCMNWIGYDRRQQHVPVDQPGRHRSVRAPAPTVCQGPHCSGCLGRMELNMMQAERLGEQECNKTGVLQPKGEAVRATYVAGMGKG